MNAACMKPAGLQGWWGWRTRLHHSTQQGSVCARPQFRSQTQPRRSSCHSLAPEHGTQDQTANKKVKLVLGIESSCDDTGVAVVTSDGRVLGEALATQAEITAAWGGVVPNVAMEAHKEAIDRVVDEALAKAGITASQLDAVAVTVGPGLALCLRVGAGKALALSHQYSLPLVRVHHMEAHALVARMGLDQQQPPSQQQPSQQQSQTQQQQGQQGSGQHQEEDQQPQRRVPFPFLCMLVSGGHNLLVLVRGVGDYVQLGTTLDDALGEAYDKVARLLGLDLVPSGGAALEAVARAGDPHAFKFVVPMRKYANCDFSYAGLKTSVRLAIEANLHKPAEGPSSSSAAAAAGTSGSPEAGHSPEASQSVSSDTQPSAAAAGGGGEAEAARLAKVRADIAASFQHVATVHLVERLSRAVTWAREMHPDLKHLVVAGGVAANQHIRSQLRELASKQGLELVVPPPRWCTDNGVMVAWAGVERMELGLVEAPYTEAVTEETWIDLKARWPLTSEMHPKSLQPASTPPPGSKKAKALAAAAAAAAASGADAAAQAYNHRSKKKARMAPSLTEVTAQELQALRERQAGQQPAAATAAPAGAAGVGA